MILVISVCKERLHYYEFVKPIEDILSREKVRFFAKHYREINKEDLRKADKVIICGTSLKDFEYTNDFSDNFDWLLDFEKPVLGICAGMQIIGFVFMEEKKEKWMYRKKYSRKSSKAPFYENLQIGLKKELFEKEFLGAVGEKEVYYLHQAAFIYDKTFELFTHSGIHNGEHNAIKHLLKPIYGTLFHPEVRNKELVVNFLNL